MASSLLQAVACRRREFLAVEVDAAGKRTERREAESLGISAGGPQWATTRNATDDRRSGCDDAETQSREISVPLEFVDRVVQNAGSFGLIDTVANRRSELAAVFHNRGISGKVDRSPEVCYQIRRLTHQALAPQHEAIEKALVLSIEFDGFIDCPILRFL